MNNKLLDYVALLAKWSKVYNLTTIRDPDQIMIQHIQDSLTVEPYLNTGELVLDVGTGAGLPGIPLAIVRPDVQFKLIDSQRKKINFVQHVITSLSLTNASAICDRIEAVHADRKVDVIVSRAFSSLQDFVNLIANVCDSTTNIIAMKGRRELVVSEASHLPENFKIVRIDDVSVPGLNAERCLVFLKKQGD